jgi:hypothetical protein
MAIHPRHPNIHQDQVKAFALRGIDRALAIFDRLFPVSTFETVWGFRLEEGFGLIAVT